MRWPWVVTHPPRKTRFRLLVRLYRTGLVTRRVPSERFQAILLSRAFLARGQCGFDHRSISGYLADRFGAEVERADSLDDTRDAMRSVRYDLVLVNRVLDEDGSSGLELIRALKHDPASAQYRSSSNNYSLSKGFLQGRSAPMFRAFLGELGHLALDYTRVDSVAARLDPLLDQLRQQQVIPLVQTLWRGAVALGSRACWICRQPVNDNRSTSRFSRWAASSISARTTKWPSDKAYNSCSTPAGVWLRKCVGLVGRRGSWYVFCSSKTSSSSQRSW